MRKNGNDLNEGDQHDLNTVTSRTQEIQKTLEKIRKQSRTHTMLKNDHQNKSQKGGMPSAPGMGGPPGNMPGMMGGGGPP